MVVHKIFNLQWFDLQRFQKYISLNNFEGKCAIFRWKQHQSTPSQKHFLCIVNVKIEEQIQLDTIFCDTNTGVVQAD